MAETREAAAQALIAEEDARLRGDDKREAARLQANERKRVARKVAKDNAAKPKATKAAKKK